MINKECRESKRLAFLGKSSVEFNSVPLFSEEEILERQANLDLLNPTGVSVESKLS